VKIRSSLGSGSLASKLFNLLQIPGIYLAEMNAAKIATTTFVCSELDRAYLARLGMAERVQSIPNALPSRMSSKMRNGRRNSVLGNYEYPNEFAAERLISQICQRF